MHFQSPVHASCVEILKYTGGNLRACDDLPTGILSSCAVSFSQWNDCFVCLCFAGLEAQLLGIVVRKERPELEEQKDALVINIAANKKKLEELEDEILR